MRAINIGQVIEYLNKTLGYDLESNYYSNIALWSDWWKGKHKPFHEFKESGSSGVRTRQMYTMKMGKKVCEDWAALLMNEKTEITLSDESASVFLLGNHAEDEETQGVFDRTEFWQHANMLIEKAFYSGTGAFVLRINGMKVSDQGRILSADSDGIAIEYLSAEQIIPLTIKNGKIIDAAFVSEVKESGKKFVYLELHILKKEGYTIYNKYFTDSSSGLIEVPLPDGMAEEVNTNDNVPLFAIFSPNIVNNIDPSTGLGISIFANAIDNLMGVDLAYNNLCRDSKLGLKKVFLDESLIKKDETGRAITPDDVAQQLFVEVQRDTLAEDSGNPLIHEYNPSLRVQENKDNIQAQLDYLSFKCGFGTKHYQFNGGQIVTATQYMGDKQELAQNATKHYITVGRALKQIIKSILWVGKEICGETIDPGCKVAISFDDSYIIDKETERERDRQDIRDGLRQKWEYRVKWLGEDEETAKSMVETEKEPDWFGDE